MMAKGEKMAEYREYIVRETAFPLGGTRQEVVGEVVRCKDCKYGHELIDEHGNIDIYRLCKGKERKADFFCADGERRDNG